MKLKVKLDTMKEISTKNDETIKEFVEHENAGNDGMTNTYFTFGSDPDYPYERGDYVLIRAQDIYEAVKVFNAIHPKRPGSNCVNCAEIYTQEQWLHMVRQYYGGRDPVEEIVIKRRV